FSLGGCGIVLASPKTLAAFAVLFNSSSFVVFGILLNPKSFAAFRVLSEPDSAKSYSPALSLSALFFRWNELFTFFSVFEDPSFIELTEDFLFANNLNL